MVERDADSIVFGQITYTLQVDDRGEPVIATLKVTKSKRKKYGK